jgi:hypothetical protein
MALIYTGYTVCYEVLTALVAAGDLSLLSLNSVGHWLFSGYGNTFGQTVSILGLLALALSWIDLAKGALPLLTTAELRAYATQHGVGLDSHGP